MSQLGIRYRGSPMSVNAPDAGSAAPLAGDRLPDAPVTVDGRTTTLHRVLTGPHVHLLMCGPVSSWAPAEVGAVIDRYAGLVTVHRLTREPNQGALGDPDGIASSRLGVTDSPALIVVRPDGYVGFRGGAGALPGVRTYLTNWFRPG